MGYTEIICVSVFTVLCVISAKIYSALNLAYTYWDKKKVNGPIPRYIYGTWSGFAEKFLGSLDYANVLNYGKVCGLYDGLTPNLLVTDPEVIKDIINDSGDKLQSLRSASENSVILKHGLQLLSGEEKPEVQALANTLLSPSKLGKVLPKLESSTEILIDNISKAGESNNAVNLTPVVTEFIDEAIAHAIFGIELNADVQFKDEFVKNTSQILKVKTPKSLSSLLPFLYESYFKESWVFPEKSLQYFVSLIITGISESSSEARLAQEKTSNLIDLMVEAAAEEKKLSKKENDEESQDLVLTDNVIISKCIASILSLVSLTRTTVLMGIYALANNEEIQDKLYKEIEAGTSQISSYEDIQNLKYLDKVVKEILRLYPFEFRLEKVATDTVKLGEIEIDKKVRVSVPLYALHRLEEYYPEPDKFNPERFSFIESEKVNGYTYLPFGQAGFNGSDISLQLAVLAAKITLLRLSEKFKFLVAQELSLSKLFQEGFTRIPQPANIEVVAEPRTKNLLE